MSHTTPHSKTTANDALLLGINGGVTAIHKATGKILWTNRLRHATIVTILATEDVVYAYASGYVYALELATGDVIWENSLPGMGFGYGLLALPGRAPELGASQAAVCAASSEARSSSD